ncbi:TolB family protein [Acrocarpospora catenulata]|uniref:TolB family protein n=1 Tax=Acrocarpospora catenulata TaxID=2836182 RepID=UPI001BD95E93|nr:hypothetical protein [Acrocarpospora catenulata]
MNGNLEDRIRSTLGHAATRAPRAPGGLATVVVSRSRRRRLRAQALTSAVAVAVVAIGVGVVIRGPGPVTVEPASPSEAVASPATEPKPWTPATETVEQVWPDAVWRMPRKLAGDVEARPRVFLDDRTLLLETWESHEKVDAIYAYDLVDGTSRKIASISTPKGVFASGFTPGSGRIIWMTYESGNMRLWSVPVEGGAPSEIHTDPPIRGISDHLAIVGDRIVFSMADGGVYTLPLDGGTATALPNGAGLHLLRWPWAGTPGHRTPNGEIAFQRLTNVETGESALAAANPGEIMVRCGITMCSGIRPGGSTGFARLRDGTQDRDLPGPSYGGLAADRFMTVRRSRSSGQDLYDLRTGRSADLGIRSDAKGESVAVEPGMGDGRLLSYPLGDEYVIIDLARIP